LWNCSFAKKFLGKLGGKYTLKPMQTTAISCLRRHEYRQSDFRSRAHG
jgi:hypothetical protein